MSSAPAWYDIKTDKFNQKVSITFEVYDDANATDISGRVAAFIATMDHIGTPDVRVEIRSNPLCAWYSNTSNAMDAVQTMPQEPPKLTRQYACTTSVAVDPLSPPRLERKQAFGIVEPVPQTPPRQS